MSHLHFISVLGTGVYEPVCYTHPAREGAVHIDTFIQISLMRPYVEELASGGRVTILLTDRARTQNWQDTTFPDQKPFQWKQHSWNSVVPGGRRSGLASDLRALCPALANCVRTPHIPDGNTREELWEQFNTIYDCIGEGDEIIFDITQGLRSIPMLAITVLNYAKVMKNCTIRGIYYGAYEASPRDKDANGYKIVPIMDMTVYNEVLEWTNAANAFLRQGTPAVLRELAHARQAGLPDEQKRMMGKVRGVVDAVDTLHGTLTTGRGLSSRHTERTGSDRKKTSIADAYSELTRKVAQLPESGAGTQDMPMQLLLRRAASAYDAYFAPREGQSSRPDWQIGCGAVEWAIDHGMVQQGYTALEETVKTYLCDRYGLLSDNMNAKEMNLYRDGIMGAVLHEGCELHPFDRAALKAQYRARIASDPKEALRRAAHDSADLVEHLLEDIPQGFFELSQQIKEQRNDINHFGYRLAPQPMDEFRRKLQEHYRAFQALCQSARLSG